MIVGNAKSCKGFTLIELLVTIGVAVILATVAVPGFQGLVATNRQAADFNEILTGLHYARSEAVKRRQEVSAVLISSSDNNGIWRLVIMHGSDVIREMEARHDRVDVSGKKVRFNSLGRRASCLDESGGPDVSCTITVGDGLDEIVIHPTGRIEKKA